MGSHRATDVPAPTTSTPVPPECTYPAGRHLLAWTGEVADAPDGQLVGRWACQGGNCGYVEPRIIPIDQARGTPQSTFPGRLRDPGP